MIIIGLTGGIGTGKSAAASILRDFGLPVYHADRAVHLLLKKGGAAVKLVARSFPAALANNAIDRKRLGMLVFGRPVDLEKLEKILHPLVGKQERQFLRKARQSKESAVVLEIPLLFETGGQQRCDFTICVTVPKRVQKARVMRRPGMTAAKLKAILARQMPDSKKRKLADYVVNTGGSYAKTKQQLRKILLENSIF